jgi:catechol 2,3-dioxygenase-like lactoylglutathione lyase family enzyme
MIDHIGFAVADAEKSRAFYEKALEPLGVSVLMSIPAGVTDAGGATHGFGRDDKAFFWVGEGEQPVQNAHVAFAAETRVAVDAFYAASVAAGGRDNGAPGLRPHYGPTYYGAFVFDPDGNNVEAVCRAPA